MGRAELVALLSDAGVAMSPEMHSERDPLLGT